MSLFTPSGLSAVRLKAERALSTLGEKGSSEMVLYGDTSIFSDLHIIYDLYELSKWIESVGKPAEEINNINSYLLHKVEGYVIKSKVPFYSAAVDETITYGQAVIPGGAIPWLQFVVGQTINPDTLDPFMSNETNSFTDPGLVGKKIEVYVDSLQLSVGLSDRLSYTFNPLTGQILFTSPLYDPSVIRIFEYVEVSTTGNPNSVATEVIEYYFGENGDIVIPGGKTIISFFVKATDTLAALTVGTDGYGSDDVISEQQIFNDGEWHSFSINYKAASTKTLYVGGVTSPIYIEILRYG